jgi:cation transport regulator ChaB
MTYKNKEELPEYMRKSMPDEAQEIYIEVYNRSWENYDEDAALGQQSQEAQAHRDGWNAVKQEYVHDEDKGIWYRKGEEPEDFEEDEDEGLLDKIT